MSDQGPARWFGEMTDELRAKFRERSSSWTTSDDDGGPTDDADQVFFRGKWRDVDDD